MLINKIPLSPSKLIDITNLFLEYL